MRVAFLAFAVAGLSALGSAQFLRSSALAFVSDPSGNDSESVEQGWILSGGADVVVRNASASTGISSSQTQFSAGFGVLKGNVDVSTNHSGAGTNQAHGWGTFFPFTNGVGASFNDSITLVGAGDVHLRVTYRLHSLLAESGAGATAESALDVYSYPTVGSVITAGPIWHTTVGESTTTRNFDIIAPAGSVYGLQADLYAFASVNATSGGFYSASADASHTGSILIEALSGSYTSASGHDYAPVPEPASLLVLGLGALALRRRKN